VISRTASAPVEMVVEHRLEVNAKPSAWSGWMT
jgi:hypothetical protein